MLCTITLLNYNKYPLLTTANYTNTLKLLRIPFSVFLMPVFILALSQCVSINSTKALISFILIHLLVYPASNGYNSYVDKDTTPIGGLQHPPMATRSLLYVTLIMDCVALLLSYLFVNKIFALAVLLYILASRAYSAKQIRLKKYPLLGFFVVIIFQGGFTYYMCSLAITEFPFEFSTPNLFLLTACSFQIAGVYPLTQIYQHEADYAQGVTTISYRLGYVGTFVFCALMFVLSNVAYYFYFDGINAINQFYVVQLFFVPIVTYFAYWGNKVRLSSTAANFTNTMRMNAIGALCMNTCFAVLYFLNH